MSDLSSKVVLRYLSKLTLPGKYVGESNYLLTAGLAVVYDHYLVYSSHSYDDDVYNQGPCYDMRTVKVIDTRNNKMISEMDLGYRIGHMTKTEKGRIAVVVRTEDNTYKIERLLVTESGTLEKDGQVPIPGIEFSCIAYSDRNFFIGDGKSLKVIDLQGKELRVFAPDFKDNSIFKSVTDIAISPDKENIFVTDFYNCSVTCMSKNGKVKVISKVPIADEDDESVGLSTIAVDNEGVVYVNDIIRWKVYVLSEYSGTFCTLVDTSDGPITISSPENKLFAVTSDTVHIYQIQYK